MIPRGICLDLETTIAGKISNAVRPPGQKRFETRIIEIGACHWNAPTEQFKRLVNPIDAPLQTGKDLVQHLHSIHQKPTQTINFWSKVLVNRKSVDSSMFKVQEDPQVWLGRQPEARANDFVRWFNGSHGPDFVSESQALRDLIAWSKTSPWLAHNGNSFDFKVIQGCALRCGINLPERKCYDTLKIFRKQIPGHKSYSQPILYENIFKKKYNAHVAIDDAKALSELCKHIHQHPQQNTKASITKTVPKHTKTAPKHTKTAPKHTKTAPKHTKTAPKHTKTAPKRAAQKPQKKQMDLTFHRRRPGAVYYIPKAAKLPKVAKLIDLPGIGPKSVAALSADNIRSVSELVLKFEDAGSEWLKNVLPYGVSVKRISTSIVACRV